MDALTHEKKQKVFLCNDIAQIMGETIKIPIF